MVSMDRSWRKMKFILLFITIFVKCFSYGQINLNENGKFEIISMQISDSINMIFQSAEINSLKTSANNYSKVDTVYMTETNKWITCNRIETIMAIITFYNGIKTQAVGYWNNGIKYREENFNELGRNGISTMWYKNGVKAYQAGHKNGKF